MHLTLIETSGNQNYIFATNKLKENVGASETTFRIGTKYVVEAVGRKYDYQNDIDGSELRSLLLSEKPIESADSDGIEIVVATSGKAILLTKDVKIANKIIAHVTEAAAREMPGLTVHGATVQIEGGLRNIHDAVKLAHQRHNLLRARTPSGDQRFQRLPFTEPCATSGLPAALIERLRNARGTDNYAFSAVTRAKRKPLAHSPLPNDDDESKIKGEDRKNRITELLESAFKVTLPKNLEEFQDVFPKSDWIAVIHADGNGLGEIFINFDKYYDAERGARATPVENDGDGRVYIDRYRKFSLSLDLCTINGAGYALKNLEYAVTKDKFTDIVPVLPLVLGGDDLTVICDGRYATKFIYDFLTRFEQETKQLSIEFDYCKEVVPTLANIVPNIANNAFGNRNNAQPDVAELGICAGAAIVKPHYPFHQAYELAAQLLGSAKKVKTRVTGTNSRPFPCSAVDFHILCDSAHSDLRVIRDSKQKAASGNSFTWAKPYVVSHPDRWKEYQNNSWLEARLFDQLQRRVRAMGAPDSEDNSKRALPNSKLHDIRESLYQNATSADRTAGLIQPRLSEEGRNQFSKNIWVDFPSGQDNDKNGRTLYFDENGEQHTHFLDALEAVEFWKGFETSGSTGQTSGPKSKDDSEDKQ